MNPAAGAPARAGRGARAGRAAAIAARWQEAIGRTSFVPFDAPEGRRRLAALATRALAALHAEPRDHDLDHDEVRAIGAGLARLGFTHPHALSGTLRVLGEELGADLPAAGAARDWPRLAALLGGVAAGFAEAVQATILDEQETIRRALLEARAQAEQARRASDARFRAIFEGAAIAIAVTGTDGRLLDVNPALQAVLGYTAEEMRGRAFAEFSHPEDAATGTDAFLALVTGRTDRAESEQRFRRKDGQDVWAHMVISLVRDAAGRPQFVIGMGEDITERRRAEQARRAAQEALARRDAEAAALQEVDRLKTEFLHTVAHELRTPLTLVHGFAELLRDRGPALGPAGVERLAGHIYAGATQLARLVDDLVVFERLERGEFAVRPAAVDLAPVLRQVIEGAQRRPGGRRVRAVLPRRLPAYADAARVAQVTANLLDNALKYAPEGPIVVRARRVGAARRPAGPGGAPAVRVQVVDHGPGVPLAEQPRLWEKFYRGGRYAGLSPVPGSGIGLAVARALVEAQGGQIGLDSRPGRGASFWFELPTGAGRTWPAPAREREPRTH